MTALMIKLIKQMFSSLILFFMIGFLLISCSSVSHDYRPNEKVAKFAEVLFKRQNLATQQVMMLFDQALSDTDEEQISQAELQMHDACHLLNEYANRETEGLYMSVFFRRKVKASLEQCDKKVKIIELVLISIENNEE